jgi:hypothetical protein
MDLREGQCQLDLSNPCHDPIAGFCGHGTASSDLRKAWGGRGFLAQLSNYQFSKKVSLPQRHV